MWIGLLAGAVLSGCQAPPPGGADKPATVEQVRQMADPDVVGVAALYDSFNPWLWTEDRARPRGVIIRALYLEGTKYKGVFGAGIIRPKLYVQERDLRGAPQWRLAKQWSFTVEEAIPYRSKRQTMLGWGYRLHLPWEDLELTGREVRMVVEFERLDGRIVTSDKKDFRVPGNPPAASMPAGT